MRKLLPGMFLILILLTGCGGGPASGTLLAASPAQPTPQPYQTSTSAPTQTLLPPLTTLTLPTTTPMIYTIAQGDSLSAIAARFHITVDALLAANPGVNAGALAVGKTLIIPTGAQATGQPIPTPAAVQVTQARCWPDVSGGLWCVVLLQNPYAETLENLSAQLTLLSPAGVELASQTAYGLLDILPPGESMPLAAYFPPPVPLDAQVRAQVLTAVRLLPGDTRYLPATVQNTLVSLEASGRSAQVSGEVLLGGETVAKSVWVLAEAYDASGTVVGLRRWESDSALEPGSPLKFSLQVASLGPAIDHVSFLVEARP